MAESVLAFLLSAPSGHSKTCFSVRRSARDYRAPDGDGLHMRQRPQIESQARMRCEFGGLL